MLDGERDLSRLAAQVPARAATPTAFAAGAPRRRSELLRVPPRPAPRVARSPGTACSSGVAEGPVCVLRSLDQAPSVRPGSILVLEYSNPGWTPVYTVAAGLVTEEGGLLSHGSIVARERGLPAVIQVPGRDPPAARRAAGAHRRRSGQRAGTGRRRMKRDRGG